MVTYSQLYPGDVNFLDTPDTYMQKLGITQFRTPQERLTLTDQSRATLYSYCVQILPRVADKILTADMDSDQEARALWIAFYNHVMDPIFVDIMIQFLRSRSDSSLNGQIGSLLSKVLEKYIKDNKPVEEKKSAKDSKDAKESKEAEEERQNHIFEQIRHIQAAIEELLGGSANTIQVRCGNLTHPEALFIAACLAMNSAKTIKEILDSDIPITADLFDTIRDPNAIIQASLRMLKSEIPTKPTPNQKAFLDSLERWIYNMLNKIPGGATACWQYLVGVYGSVHPDVSPYYIQIKDCGTMYTNLLTVAKQIVNK